MEEDLIYITMLSFIRESIFYFYIFTISLIREELQYKANL